jgi:hypothetical protein
MTDNTKEKELELGERVLVKAVAKRAWGRLPGIKDWYGNDRYGDAWKRYENKEPVSGVFVGSRTVWDGYTMNNGEDGLEFKPIAHHQVYLVAINKRSFVRAFPEDVTRK